MKKNVYINNPLTKKEPAAVAEDSSEYKAKKKQ